MLVLLLACTVLQMLTLTDATARYFIVAPNMVRVDVDETVLLSVFGTPDGVQIPVTLYFQLAGSNDRISERIVHVSKGEPQEATLRVSRDDLPQRETRGQEFVTLFAISTAPQLQFNDQRVILLSPRGGFVFIQTDKPLYTPNQRVDIRIVALNQDMNPSDHEVQIDVINPDQIIIQREQRRSDNGFIPLQFDFPPKPIFGNWTVTVYYGYQLEASTSVQFEVKEYVLPKFYVEVNTNKKYIVPETRELSIKVTARYLFGEPVFGSFFVKFGVMADDGHIIILQEQQGLLNDVGQGFTDMIMSEVSIPNWANTLMGKQLIIQAYVTDPSTLETVNANNTLVTFSNTPYKFNWDLTQRFFKRGLPFVVKASVHFLSGLPAPDIPVRISVIGRASDGTEEPLAGEDAGVRIQLSGEEGEVYFRLDVTKNIDLVIISLETQDPNLVNANAESSFEVLPQQAPIDEYLLVHIPTVQQQQRIDEKSTVEVHLTNTNHVEMLNYFVIAGGKIVSKGSIPSELINPNKALTFTVTQEMVPSARVVAYYIHPNGHVIADALYMEVQEKCENPIDLSFKNLDEVDGVYKTDGNNKNIELEISGKQGTNVGLLAVDEAIFKLRYYHRLTQKKVFKRMASYDLGCGAGGGQTSAKVFEDAGVAVLSNTQLNVAMREEEGCFEDRGRSKRSVNDTRREEILRKYEGVELEYCEMGMRQLTEPEELSCITRSKRLARRKDLSLESDEILAFLFCCNKTSDISSRGRAGGGNNDLNFNKITVRYEFPESWMFTNIKIDERGSALYRGTLPDSVTTWVVEGVGVSQQYDFCVADPIKLQVRPPFFLDINMPYSVQRYEQIEIVVSVFNYAGALLKVMVSLKGREGLCSEALPGDYSDAKPVQVPTNRGASVSFVIVPLEVGRIPIEVAAVTEDQQYSDAIRKKLLVRPEGYEQTDVVTFTLDPENTRQPREALVGRNQSYRHDRLWDQGGEGTQVDIIRYDVNGNAIPGTHQVHVSLTGNMMGSVVETVIGGLDQILSIPTGCGEQTMIRLGPNVYVYRYLKHTDQFTANLEISTKRYITEAIQWELRYRHDDGSFSVWGQNSKHEGSTWLTAFVSKVFCQAREFSHFDEKVTCKAMQWLVEQARNTNDDGSFKEMYKVVHREMTGGVQGSVSLTAYVLISLLECECSTYDTSDAVAKATSFLEEQLDGLIRPYAIAITAYALALADSDRVDDAIDKLKGIETYEMASDSRHWTSDDSVFAGGTKPYWYSNRPRAIEVETTSYALLALLQKDQVAHSHAIVNWLTDQENYNGGFASTQDTVIALQALSEYAIKTQDFNIELECEVTCEQSGFSRDFMLRPDNALVRQHAEIVLPELSPEFSVHFKTQGQGTGQAKFKSTYFLPEAENTPCDFELIVNEDAGGNRQQEKELSYNIQTRYLRGEATGMAILDVGLYTGYVPIKDSLEAAKEASNGQIQQYEVTDRSVVFYLEEITMAEATSISFRAERIFEVGKIQPVSVRVFDYYNPTVECVKFIHPQEGSNMLGLLCTGDTCECAAGDCASDPFKSPGDYDVYDMKVKACQSESHFAYKVRVDSVEEKGSFQMYTMTILSPLKDGLKEVYKKDRRTFWKTKSCDTPNLEINKIYLVIGRSVLAAKDDVGNTMYKYIIDGETFVYIWPKKRMLTRNNKWTVITERLSKLEEDLLAEGCPT